MNFTDILSPACALFLDFDGTLVEIAAQPEAVVAAEALVPTLEALQQYLGGAIAVISGRPMDQIDAFLAPLRLPLAGVHGAERRASGGQLTLLPLHPMHAVEEAAGALARHYPKLLVENKRGSVALHYRQAPELQALCLEVMQAALDQSPGLTLLHGKMVVEAKPGGASKGHAIEAFMLEPPFAGRTPVFVGDDFTDEVGFSTVQRLGGLGVKIGDGPSVAWQRMATPAALLEGLGQALAARGPKVAA